MPRPYPFSVIHPTSRRVLGSSLRVDVLRSKAIPKEKVWVSLLSHSAKPGLANMGEIRPGQ